MVKFFFEFALFFVFFAFLYFPVTGLYNYNFASLHLAKSIEVSTYGWSQQNFKIQNDKDYFENKGFELYRVGNYASAIELYDKVLAMDPNDKDALTNKGSAL